MTTDPAGQYHSPYLSMGNNWVSQFDPDGGTSEDHWEIDEDGNAILVDTEGDGIWIRKKGSENYVKLSEFKFAWGSKAANQIIDYYASSFDFFNNGEISLNAVTYNSEYDAFKAGLDKNELAFVRGRYDPGLIILDFQITDPSFDIDAIVPLFNGRFISILDNKYNLINTLAHEYKHVLDNYDIKNLIESGMDYHSIEKMTKSQMELRAIDYQRNHESWQCVTLPYVRNIQWYENKFSN